MDTAAVDAFWEDAKVHANLNRLRAYLGPAVAEVLRPPAWSFGGAPAEADRLLAQVLAGERTATVSALRDYEAAGEALPSRGTMSIVTDSDDLPRALIVTSEVRVLPLAAIDAADLDPDQDRSAEDQQMVLERFEVLYAPDLTS